MADATPDSEAQPAGEAVKVDEGGSLEAASTLSPAAGVVSSSTAVLVLSEDQPQSTRLLVRSCRQLAPRDVSGLADPFIVAFQLSPPNRGARAQAVAALERERLFSEAPVRVSRDCMQAALRVVLGPAVGCSAEVLESGMLETGWKVEELYRSEVCTGGGVMSST